LTYNLNTNRLFDGWKRGKCTMNDSDDLNKRPVESRAGESKAPKVVSASELFAGAREICIEHEGERYVLRITRRGKLILQK
jgi:hemin uptake protein HemP